MARARAAEHHRSRSKTTHVEEIARAINKFQDILVAINDLRQEGFPYRDAAQSKAQLQFRECLRHTFGERSQEFQTYRNFKLRTADKTEVAQSLTVIKGLIQTLEDRKLELQGLKPPPTPGPTHEASLSNTARMVLVSSATPTTSTDQTNSPMTVAVAMTTHVEPSVSPPISTPQIEPIVPTLPPTPTTASAPIQTPTFVMPEPHVSAIPGPIIPSPSLELPPLNQPMPSMVDGPTQVPPSLAVSPAFPSISIQRHTDAPAAALSTQPIQCEAARSVVPVPQDPPSDKPSISLSRTRFVESVLDSTLDQDPLHLVRKVCHRFHAVARQLRLRRDYRATLEVEDDYDLQDLLCALLKVEFDEVATDEWIPPYTGGAPRTTLLVNRDQIAVVAKKTRPGLTTKELADQVAADAAYYRAQGRCSTLFCFLYDPEGRIGSPKRLETTLTSVIEHCRVEVLVAPK